MKIDIGSVYTAHLFIDGERKITSDFYHFQIMGKSEAYSRDDLYLAVKLNVEITSAHSQNQAFWFNRDGIYSENPIRFELKRKIKKEPQILIAN